MAIPILSVQLNPSSSPVNMDLSAVIDTAFGSTVSNMLQRSSAGWKSVSTNTLTGPLSIPLYRSGAISVATDVSLWGITPSNMTGLRIDAVLKTPAVGADFIFDILKSPYAGLAFTSISSGFGFTINDGNHQLSGAVQPAVSAFTQHDLFRLDILQVGSGTAGSDLTVIIFGDALPI